MMVKIYRSYRCDAGHAWVVARSEAEGEQAADTLCPFGHPAVTCCVEMPVDDLQILISPAARIVDSVKQQRILDGRYRLSLLDKAGVVVRSAAQDYDWDEAVKLAGLFRGKSPEQALKWWDRRRP